VGGGVLYRKLIKREVPSFAPAETDQRPPSILKDHMADADNSLGASELSESGDEDDSTPLVEREVRRKHRNRLSAAASRLRKKEWLETLQEQLRALTDENEMLHEQLAAPTAQACAAAGLPAQAGAAAGLLAFGGGVHADSAISEDLVLGRLLLAHGISAAIHIHVHADHLGRAAALAAGTETACPNLGSTPDLSPADSMAPTPSTMSPAELELPPRADALHSAFAFPSSLSSVAWHHPSLVASERPGPEAAAHPPAFVAAEPATQTWSHPLSGAKRPRLDPHSLHERAETEPPADADASAAAPIQLDLVRALRSLRAPPGLNLAHAGERPTHALRACAASIA